MAVEIVAVGSGWHVVDTSVPGGHTLERHSERARAEAAAERLGGRSGETIEAAIRAECIDIDAFRD